MPWSTPTPSGDVVAIHAALVPTANGDGEILLFGGDNHERNANLTSQFDHARRFNCRHPDQPLTYVQSPPYDVFCAGHAFLGDGRLMVAGGTAQFPADAGGIHHNLHFGGHRHTSIYNPPTGTFLAAADMGPEPGLTTGGGRWYPTLCTLSTGEVVAFQGHPDEDDGRHGNTTPERYQPLANRWIMLPEIGAPVGDPIVYPRLHLLRDGWVFVSSEIEGFAQCIAFDPWSGATRTTCPLPDAAYRGFNFPSVLLPLVPGDGYRARVLLCGAPGSQLIDLGAASPAWQNVPRAGSTSGQARIHANATLLPTGDVLMTGGTVDNGSDQTGVMPPERYSLPWDAATHAYSGGSGQWNTLDEPATVLRNYHSTALLMPDGRVWTAGGNSPDQPNLPPTDNQKRIEIFDPPYPAGPRPTIDAAPTVLAYGDLFSVGYTSAAAIRTVVLMRCGSSTHAFNPDQRAVVLSFSPAGTGTLTATAPPDGGVAPPGQYMLFIVDDQGRPCAYASFVRLGGRLSLFTNRSHFSIHEVEALVGGGPAWVPQSFYVVLDGFAAADVAGTPGRPFPPPPPQFHFEVGGGVVPDLSAELQDVLYESPSAPPNATQRITLAYRLRFTSTHAFDGLAPGEERGIRIDASWGPTQASGRMFVFQHEHVYALDGPVPWLSVDVRVGQVARGAALAGLPDADPIGYVQAQVARFRSLPGDEFHPFLTLSTDQSASQLQLAPTMGGATIDNFAFAKVRFRAPAGIDAADVKVFFRLFTTAVTNLDYNQATIYARTGNGPTALPQQGYVGGEVASIPFFATARSDLAVHPDPTNVDTLHGGGATEVTSYFGCWLDFNHDDTLRNQIRGRHQCLVAEIHYPPSPIVPGSTPANHDQLSQRNLAIVESDNPGWPSSHVVAHTFELKPSEGGGRKASPAPAEYAAAVGQGVGPDELFIRWNGLPQDSVVTVYIPGAGLAEAVEYGARRPGSDALAAVDADTVRCRVGDATYLPIPGGSATNLAGLITIQLPPTVLAGSSYTVSLHQVSTRRRAVIGSFDFTIPVGYATQLVGAAQRDLAVLRQIGATIPPGNRWYPVFQRYLGLLTDRVRAFGGDPDAGVPGRSEGGPCCRFGLGVAALLAVWVVALAFAGTAAGRVAAVALGLLTLGAAVLWQRRCMPGVCGSLWPLLVGIGVGAAVVGVVALAGAFAAPPVVLMAVALVVVAVVAVVMLARRCIPCTRGGEGAAAARAGEIGWT